MDFYAFEQLVLQVLFETDEPISAPYAAYAGGISVALAERYLARMAENGTLVVRCDARGAIEYVFDGRRDARKAFPRVDASAFESQRQTTVATSVMLSLLVPGAGHIYAGRTGAGYAWMATTLVGYACCILPGLFLHGLCLVSAAQARQH